MDAYLQPAVAKIADELRCRPKGTKRMSARRLLRLFGYERRSHENVREIRGQFQRAGIHLEFDVGRPPTLDEPVFLHLDPSPGASEAQVAPSLAAPPLPAPPELPALPRPGELSGHGRRVVDVIAAVARATVQVFTEEGGGSGVVVDPDGLVLTCRHVVEGEDGLSERTARVDLWDGTHEAATVVRSHRALDFALLVVPRRGLPAVPMGDSLGLRAAESVYVVGSPAGLANSVSRGIVSAPRRTCLTNIEYIQTDAAIQPGNSGGPVVTESGDLVGIITWAYRGEEPARTPGISFAVPVDYVADEVAALRRLGLAGARRRPYCRHCGWLQSEERRYCENCGAMFVEKILEGSAR
ncbi:MAG: trypsin-like peptidase domain-containing protein [Armatimonadetes bacterium]|nr:trypsin-like peptidase domain-containing protein [Armatimonadota bacterium]